MHLKELSKCSKCITYSSNNQQKKFTPWERNSTIEGRGYVDRESVLERVLGAQEGCQTQLKVGKTGTKAQKLKFLRKKVEKGENEDEGTCTTQPSSSTWHLGRLTCTVHVMQGCPQPCSYQPRAGLPECAFSVGRVNWDTQAAIKP